MRMRTDAATVDIHAEVGELIRADAALKEGTRIDAGRAMALNEQQVARMLGGGSMPKMVETHVVKCGGRAEGGDMAAQIAGLAIGAHHHSHCVPAEDRTHPPQHGRASCRERVCQYV